MFTFEECKKRTLVMGILNVTPDSFSDGGESFFAEKALEKALKMQNDGADIIDIGAVSTAPKSEKVELSEELRRLKTVFPLVASRLDIPVSVDTRSPEAAQFALENGAVIVNDESGAFSSNMASLVKKHGAGWIFMHTGGKASSECAEYENGVVADALSFFEKMREAAAAYGINEESLCYDYGIGFGKTREEDLLLLKSTAEFSEYSPLLVGVSRKRVIGEATGEKEPKNRIFGTVAAESIAAFLGAGILRVHDVKAARDAVKTVEAVKKGSFNIG